MLNVKCLLMLFILVNNFYQLWNVPIIVRCVYHLSMFLNFVNCFWNEFVWPFWAVKKLRTLNLRPVVFTCFAVQMRTRTHTQTHLHSHTYTHTNTLARIHARTHTRSLLHPIKLPCHLFQFFFSLLLLLTNYFYA